MTEDTDHCEHCGKRLQPDQNMFCADACYDAWYEEHREELETPITIEKAREHLKAENFARYRELGGQLPKRSYNAAAARFVWHTFDIYIGGDPLRHESRQEAWHAFDAWLQKRYPGESPHRIFRSLDDVDAYT